MNIIKKIASLTLALAMILTLTPIYGAWFVSYAEDEDPFPFPFYDLEQIDGQLDGRDNLLYDTTEVTYRIPDDVVSSDDSVTEIVPFVGLPEVEAPDGGWTSLGDSCYSYVEEDHTITVYGSDVAAEIDRMFPNPEWLPEQVGISFRAVDAEGNDKWVAGTIANFRFTYVGYEDNLQGDRTVLPGWDGSFDGERYVWVEDKDHPDGEDVPVTINDVSIKEGEDLLEEFHEDSDEWGNRWWYYRAGSMGTVTFEITYTDLEGTQKKYDAHLYINSDVYEASVWTDGGVYEVLPGDEIHLNAWALHKFWNGRYENATEEGLDFIWTLERGGEFAEVIRDENDHSKATLRFKDMGEDEGYRFVGARVKVTVIDKLDADDPDGEKAAETRWLNCNSDFYGIYPVEMDGNIGLGEKISDQKFEVRHYKFNGTEEEGYNSERYKTIKIAKTSWDFNEEEVNIKRSNGEAVEPGTEYGNVDTFSFERKAEWDFNIRLFANFINEEGDYDERQAEFHFDWMDYNIWFNDGDGHVYDDGEWTIDLEKDDNADFSNIEIRYTVTGFCFDEDSWEDVEIEGPVPEDCYRISEDKLSVTAVGEAMERAGISSLRVEAKLFYNDRDLDRWTDCWFHLEESCSARGEEHMWLTYPADYSDCYSTGLQKQICWHCNERRIVEVPARGHIATAVKAKAATASEEGNVAYWTCEFCGKCFSDSNCTKEVEEDSRIIPKGTTIFKLAALSKGFNVTWKKPADDYLKHTTGYEVMYALDSKFKKSPKTVKITKSGTITKKVTKLKSKTKYYVKVRAYRTIDGKKYYSPWSKAKNIKTK